MQFSSLNSIKTDLSASNMTVKMVGQGFRYASCLILLLTCKQLDKMITWEEPTFDRFHIGDHFSIKQDK